MSGSGRRMEPIEWAKYVIRNRDDRNYVEAYSIFVREAKAGNAEAQYCVGLMHARGQGLEKDHAVALGWFEQAHSNGYRGASYFLGKMHLLGMGTEKDPAKARMYFEEVAGEDARASYELGLLHFSGKDAPRNLEESARWMTVSAEAGNAEAQFVLGQFYKAGAGVEKNPELAVKWLSAAALNRHKGAQILLGNMYRTGDCVKVDTEESDRWYDMADGKSNVSARPSPKGVSEAGGGGAPRPAWALT